ncbi:MAG: hypothetical protein RLZ70_753 [Verrucomicrobiota bacterium]
MFIDEAKVILKSGAGGHGCVSFRREKFIPKGGAGSRTAAPATARPAWAANAPVPMARI